MMKLKVHENVNVSCNHCNENDLSLLDNKIIENVYLDQYK